MPLSNYTLIKASAGSGKTYRLTETIAAEIAGGLHPSQVIATTFTRKAAAELTGRIRERLVDKNLLHHAAAMPAALVGTVNSVAGQLLSTFALDAGLSPDLTVLTEHTQNRAFNAATAAIIAEVENEHRGLLFRTGYDRQESEGRSGPRNRVDFAATVRSVVNYARTNNIESSELARSREASIESFLQLFDGVTQTDNRHLILKALNDTAALFSDPPKIEVAPRSQNAVGRWVRSVRDFTARVERNGLDGVTWAQWCKADSAAHVGEKAPSPVKNNFVGTGTVSTRLRDELVELIGLVFNTAAACMDAYQGHKKARGQIDFIDQEHLTLQLLERPEIREAIGSRYKLLAVDEFQDTSPLQLALFMKLASAVEKVVWVGDVKQAIYGFRDADPELMKVVSREMEKRGGKTEVLNESWRTHAIPLKLSNEIFSGLFPGPTDESGRNEDVWLDIPEALKEKRTGGEAELWQSPAKATIAQWAAGIAQGVKELIRHDADPDATYAVLTRSQSHAGEVQEQLEARGVLCARAGRPLREATEGQLLIAALRWILDHSDTKSLIELVSFLDDHEAHEDWFTKLAALPNTAEREAKLAQWAASASLEGLVRLRNSISEYTVGELVSKVVNVLDLRSRTARWHRGLAGAAAVAGAVQAAEEYVEETLSSNAIVSLAGLIEHLSDGERSFVAPVSGPGAVMVGTVHSAKGLEWDTVVAALPKPTDRFSPSGSWVHPGGAISLENPLEGRTVRFWPQTALESPMIKERAAADPVQQERRHAELEEERRLLYVALTRSARRTIIAPNKELGTISAFQDIDVKVVDPNKRADLSRAQGVMEIPVLVREISAEALPSQPRVGAPDMGHEQFGLWADRGIARRAHAGVPARFTASGLQTPEQVARESKVELLAVLGPGLTKGQGEATEIGDCVHSYLAAPYANLEEARRRELAERIITQWGVSDSLRPETLVSAGDRFSTWVRERYPGATARTEVPFVAFTRDHQRAEGWMDLVLDTGEGRVVIDHKTYAGSDPVSVIREHYIAQLDVYRQVFPASTPVSCLIHLPMRGEVYRVELPLGQREGRVEVVHPDPPAQQRGCE